MAENDNNNNQEIKIPPVSINMQYVKKINFDSPNAPVIFKELNKMPNIDINVSVNADHLENNLFNVDLNIKANSGIDEKVTFNLDVIYSAVVQINNVPEEDVESVLLIEVPTFIFPFARNVVANAVIESGFPPLLISPVNFTALYNKEFSNEENNEEKVN